MENRLIKITAAMSSKGLLALSGMLLGCVMLNFGFLSRWLGGAMIAGCLGLTFTLYKTSLRSAAAAAKGLFPKERYWDAIVFALLAVAAGIYFYKRIISGNLISIDHNVHIIQTQNLLDNLAFKGQIWGWTHSRFAGLPVNYFYPFGAYFWALAVHYLFLGLLPLEISYGLAVLFAHILGGVTVYLLGRRAFNRTIGFVAGLLVIIDIAAAKGGDLYWVIAVGIWPVYLSLALSLLALICLEDMLNNNGRGRKASGLFGLFMGLAILCHPLAVIFFGIVIPLSCIANCFLSGLRWSRSGFSRLGPACLGGISIGGLWFIPFLLYREYTTIEKIKWHSLGEYAFGVINASVAGMGPYLSIFGLAGCLCLLFSKNLTKFLVGLIPFVFLFIGSTTFLNGLNLHEWMPAFKNIHYPRLLIIAKRFFVIGAVYMAYLTIVYVKSWLTSLNTDNHGDKGGKDKAVKASFIKLFLIGLFVLPVLNAMTGQYFKRVNSIINPETADYTQLDKEYANLAEYVNSVYQRDSAFFRTADLLSREKDHRFYYYASMFKMPLYRDSQEPANYFKYKLVDVKKDVLRFLNVRYAFSDAALNTNDYELLGYFGNPLMLYRLKERKDAPFAVRNGTADVKVRLFSDEKIIFDIAPGASGELLLPVSFFPGWKANVNGRPVELYETSLFEGFDNGFITTDLNNGPGRYTFQFTLGAPEKMSVLLFMLGLVLVLLLVTGQQDLKKDSAG